MEGTTPAHCEPAAPPQPPVSPPPPPPPPPPQLPPLPILTREISNEVDATTSQSPLAETAHKVAQNQPQKETNMNGIIQQHRQWLDQCHAKLTFALNTWTPSELDAPIKAMSVHSVPSNMTLVPPTPCSKVKVAMQWNRSPSRSPRTPKVADDASTTLDLPGSISLPCKSPRDTASNGNDPSDAKFAITSTTFATRAAKKAQEKLMKTLQRSQSGKFKKDGKHADDYLTAHARKHAEYEETRLEKFVTSTEYELLSMLVIFVNCGFLCAQTQHIGTQMLKGEGNQAGREVFWVVGNVCFCIVYATDLALRWSIDGVLGFFETKDRWWNCFDILIVGASIVELVLDMNEVMAVAGTHISILRVLRVMRVVRVLRIMRLVSVCQQLRNMLHSLMLSFLNLFWVAVVFGLIFMVFGIMFTIAVAEYCQHGERWRADETAELRAWFGTLHRSTVSLLMGITGGRDWSEYYEVLEELSIPVGLAYIGYIWFSIIAALNIVTGIFVQGALKTAELDRDFLIQQELQEKEKYVNEMRCLFEEMDVSNSGGITLDEFEAHLDDERAIAYFNAMEIDFDQAKTLFVLLDTDCSGSVDFQEFLSGCEKLQGNARSIDLAMMHYEVRWLASALLTLQDSSLPLLS